MHMQCCQQESCKIMCKGIKSVATYAACNGVGPLSLLLNMRV